MQVKLEMISNENNKASKPINHKDGTAELRSNNQLKANKNFPTDNLKNCGSQSMMNKKVMSISQ